MLRRWVTPLTTGSFLLVAVTGILLLLKIRPGLTVPAHEWLGLLFVAVAVLHLVLHRGSMLAHLRRPAGWGSVALFLALTVAALTVPVTPRRGPHGGEGRHAPGAGLGRALRPALERARIDQLAELAGIGGDSARARLESAGLREVTDSAHLGDLARASGVPSEEALLALFGGGSPRP